MLCSPGEQFIYDHKNKNLQKCVPVARGKRSLEIWGQFEAQIIGYSLPPTRSSNNTEAYKA